VAQTTHASSSTYVSLAGEWDIVFTEHIQVLVDSDQPISGDRICRSN
jgi:hypothetical protein